MTFTPTIQLIQSAWAVQLFNKALVPAWQKWLRSLTGRRSLLTLDQFTRGRRILGSHHLGIQEVNLAQIKGTESPARVTDFDASFRPLRRALKDRWVRVYMAWEAGRQLPPVSLLQIGDTYFVRDGHHRISAARTLGHREIYAEVTQATLSDEIHFGPVYPTRPEKREPLNAPELLPPLVR